MFVPWVALLATELGPALGGLAGVAATGLYLAAAETVGFPHDPASLVFRLAPLVGVAAAPLALVGLMLHEHAYVQAGQSVPLA